jgi:hypothetical protein
MGGGGVVMGGTQSVAEMHSTFLMQLALFCFSFRFFFCSAIFALPDTFSLF